MYKRCLVEAGKLRSPQYPLYIAYWTKHDFFCYCCYLYLCGFDHVCALHLGSKCYLRMPHPCRRYCWHVHRDNQRTFHPMRVLWWNVRLGRRMPFVPRARVGCNSRYSQHGNLLNVGQTNCPATITPGVCPEDNTGDPGTLINTLVDFSCDFENADHHTDDTCDFNAVSASYKSAWTVLTCNAIQVGETTSTDPACDGVTAAVCVDNAWVFSARSTILASSRQHYFLQVTFCVSWMSISIWFTLAVLCSLWTRAVAKLIRLSQ